MGEDKFLVIMNAFVYCRKDYRIEILNGMSAGLKIAYDSAKAGKGFSKDLYGYLNSKSDVPFSVESLKQSLGNISDISIKESTFMTNGGDLQMLESRPDYINGMKILYEIAMQGFLEIIKKHTDIKESMPFLMIYLGSLEYVIRGLRYDTDLI